MIGLQSHPAGVVLPGRASAGARRNELSGEHDGRLKISVTQAPEKGKANKAIALLLSKELGLRKSQVQLLSGETSPLKQFLIEGVSVAQLQSALRPLLP